MSKCYFIIIGFVACLSTWVIADDVPANNAKLKLYFDADWSRHRASARSIEMGMKTAFAEIDNRVQGFEVDFVKLDHRGNTNRSKINMKKAFKDPEALLVVAGMHSPPLIKNRTYINENKMLTLVPWAAGGPITRYPSSENWIFRLSIDDTQAGIRIVEYAVQQGQCKRPHLLLEQTPWGESNRLTMRQAVFESLGTYPNLTWFNWGVGIETARNKLREIKELNSDCVFFVGNAIDGETISRAIFSLSENKRLPIFSHWGITGGKFAQNLTTQILQQIDLAFIQTCFSFVSSKQTPYSKRVFKAAQSLFPELQEARDLKAPSGFIHAYDLGKVLIQALKSVQLTQDMAANRRQLRASMESLEGSVMGLIKKYQLPFSVFSEQNTVAHEALRLEDFCMAKYGPQNEIMVLPND